MALKITPGPWFVRGDLNLIVDTNGPGYPCTIVCHPGGSKGADLEELQANARLIAAAPELLEALRCAMYVTSAQIESLTGNQKSQAQVCIKTWSELFAKAEGR